MTTSKLSKTLKRGQIKDKLNELYLIVLVFRIHTLLTLIYAFINSSSNNRLKNTYFLHQWLIMSFMDHAQIRTLIELIFLEMRLNWQFPNFAIGGVETNKSILRTI